MTGHRPGTTADTVTRESSNRGTKPRDGTLRRSTRNQQEQIDEVGRSRNTYPRAADHRDRVARSGSRAEGIGWDSVGSQKVSAGRNHWSQSHPPIVDYEQYVSAPALVVREA